MKTGANLKNRQGGAVAVIVGISLVLLIGFLAMVIDLGHLYVAKTELQNGADAAALAGAKELNGKGIGVASAISLAQQSAGKNVYDFDKPIFDITDIPTDNDNIDIWVGTCPEDSCMVPATSTMPDATAAGRTFLKVHTRNRDLVTWFAPIWNIFHVSTYGVAVAGTYMQDIAPLAVCAIDENDTANYGYVKGAGYNISEINRILRGLSSGDQYWLHPTATSSADCVPNFASTNEFLPFLCQGKSAITVGANVVISNTGSGGNSHNKAVNTRFGWRANYYDNKLTAQLCAPDLNVMQFSAKNFWQPKPNNAMEADWFTYPTPTFDKNYNLTLDPNSCLSPGSDTVKIEFGQGTPLAKYDVPACTPNKIYVGATRNPGSEASVLGSYVKPSQTDLAGKITYTTPPYQAGLAGTTKYYSPPYQPSGVTPRLNRRILNLVFVDCRGPDGGACSEIPKLGVGQFFLPVEGGLPQDLYAEYVRMISSANELKSEIRLYQE